MVLENGTISIGVVNYVMHAFVTHASLSVSANPTILLQLAAFPSWFYAILQKWHALF